MLFNLVLYKGSFIEDKREDFGRHVWPDGAKYEGDYTANIRHGKGTYQYPDIAVAFVSTYRRTFVASLVDACLSVGPSPLPAFLLTEEPSLMPTSHPLAEPTYRNADQSRPPLACYAPESRAIGYDVQPRNLPTN